MHSNSAKLGSETRFEAFCPTAKGKPRWWDVRVSPMRDARGTVLKIISVSRDITRRRRQDEQLRSSEERFQLSMEATNDGLWDWNTARDTVYFSPSYYRILGYEPGDIPGTLQSWKGRVHPEDLDRTVKAKMACVEGRTDTFAVEYRMVSRSGEWRWILGRGKCIGRNSAGRASRLIGTHVDITQRKSDEATRAHLAAVVASSSDAIISKSLDGVVTSWNSSAERMFGYPADEIIGTSIRRIVPSDRYAEEDGILARIADGERIDSFETVRRCQMGRLVDVSVTISPIHDEAGRVVGASTIAHDITERKRAETNLAFFAGLMQTLAAPQSPLEIARIAAETVVRHLGASRCALMEIDGDWVQILCDHVVEGAPSLIGRHPISDFHTPEQLVELAAGNPVSIDDVGRISRSCETLARLAALKVGSVLTIPRMHGGTWRFGLSLVQSGPRAWQADEVHLLQEVVTRVYIRIERARAEEALRESEQRLDLALHASATGVWDFDLQTGNVAWSGHIHPIYGVEQFDGTAAAFFDFVHPQDREQVRSAVHGALDTGSMFIEFRIVRPNGDVRWVNNHAKILNSSGGSARLLGTVRDITERKEAENALRAANDTFRQLVDRSPFGIYAIDADFRLIQVSEGAKKVFRNVRPLIGRDLAEVLRYLWPESFANEVIGHFRRTLETGEPYQSTNTTERRADTDAIEAYDWKLERIAMPDGRPGVVCHFYDLSERKRYEEHIHLLLREVNHRAKNMLALVQAVARQTAASSPQDFIEKFSQRVQGLSANQDLLVNSNWTTVPLEDLVRSQLAHFSDLRDQRVSIEGPPVEIAASASQALGMALHELATNAAKYGALSNDAGRVEINWAVDSGGEGSPRFTITWEEKNGPRVAKPSRTRVRLESYRSAPRP